jgi:hypothetical protein
MASVAAPNKNALPAIMSFSLRFTSSSLGTDRDFRRLTPAVAHAACQRKNIHNFESLQR